jgi:hypothetical protein
MKGVEELLLDGPDAEVHLVERRPEDEDDREREEDDRQPEGDEDAANLAEVFAHVQGARTGAEELDEGGLRRLNRRCRGPSA